jgi:hypothetical protein
MPWATEFLLHPERLFLIDVSGFLTQSLWTVTELKVFYYSFNYPFLHHSGRPVPRAGATETSKQGSGSWSTQTRGKG